MTDTKRGDVMYMASCSVYVMILDVLLENTDTVTGCDRSSVIDHPPTLQWNPPDESSEKENKSIIMG